MKYSKLYQKLENAPNNTCRCSLTIHDVMIALIVPTYTCLAVCFLPILIVTEALMTLFNPSPCPLPQTDIYLVDAKNTVAILPKY